MKEFNYEEELKRRKELAKTIWDNPFVCGLTKFNKSDLLILVDLLAERLSNSICAYYSKLDLKDSAFMYKCNIIETLQEDFFKSEE